MGTRVGYGLNREHEESDFFFLTSCLNINVVIGSYIKANATFETESYAKKPEE